MVKVEKHHFKMKIRRLFEKFIRKFGVPAIESVTPTADHRLVRHIRKVEESKKKKKVKIKTNMNSTQTSMNEH